MAAEATNPRWFTESDVGSRLDLTAAMAALREGLRLESEGRAENMVKTHVVWGTEHHTLHAIGAVAEGIGLAATKTWAHTAGGASPVLVLFDTRTGEVRAVMEAFALGQMRTAGLCGVATDCLAPPDARVMAIGGSGKQALAQVAAVAAVRELREVRVWSPTEEHRDRFVERVGSELGLGAKGFASMAEAAHEADVVTLVTRSRLPVLEAGDLPRRVHINAVGAITPERAELDASVITAASLVCTDSRDQVRSLARDLNDAYGADPAAWTGVARLCDVFDRSPCDAVGVTVFRPMGVGLSDLSVANAVLAGRSTLELPARSRASIRWRAVPK